MSDLPLLTQAEIAFILRECALSDDTEENAGHVSPERRHFVPDSRKLSMIRQRTAAGLPVPAGWIRWLFERYVDI